MKANQSETGQSKNSQTAVTSTFKCDDCTVGESATEEKDDNATVDTQLNHVNVASFLGLSRATSCHPRT